MNNEKTTLETFQQQLIHMKAWCPFAKVFGAYKDGDILFKKCHYKPTQWIKKMTTQGYSIYTV